MTSTLLVIAVVASGIVAGGMLIVLIAIIPTRAAIGPERGLQLHNLTSPKIDMLLPGSVIVTMVATILLLVLGDLSSGQTVAVVIGLIGAATIAFLSVRFNMPKNRKVAKWDSPQPEYDSLFKSWNQVHLLRVLCAVTAFVALAIAAVLD